MYYKNENPLPVFGGYRQGENEKKYVLKTYIHTFIKIKYYILKNISVKS